MDQRDKELLDHLSRNARMTNLNLSRALGKAPSAVLERTRKLEKKGVIQAYETRIDPAALGLHLTFFMRIKTDEKVGVSGVGKKIARLPEILEVHMVAGESCYLLKVRVEDPKSYRKLLCHIGRIKGVVSSETIMVLETLKENLNPDPIGDVKEP